MAGIFGIEDAGALVLRNDFKGGNPMMHAIGGLPVTGFDQAISEYEQLNNKSGNRRQAAGAASS